ncbi:iron chelate uptake ABC transporter family permease subunit, partial [Streptomyces albiflaviniger]|nr:iron chelate uptake ABC transporter family permease subunit [Streptomyces albiflaviniger]
MTEDVVHQPALGPTRPAPGVWLPIILYMVLALALIAALLWSMVSGRYQVPFSHVMAILAAHVMDVTPTWTPTERIVVEVVRLPRVLTAAIAGAGLSLCGAVLQGLF